MMSLNQPETQALGAIADGLSGADPRLASMLTIFSRPAAGEEMPAREKTRTRRTRRPPTVRATPDGTRAGGQPSCKRADCTRGWAGTRPYPSGMRSERPAHTRAVTTPTCRRTTPDPAWRSPCALSAARPASGGRAPGRR